MLRIAIYVVGVITAHSFILKNQVSFDKKLSLIRKTKSTKLHGIPKLFRWLVDLYPVVQQSVSEGLSISVDNFYLDMNGSIRN